MKLAKVALRQLFNRVFDFNQGAHDEPNLPGGTRIRNAEVQGDAYADLGIGTVPFGNARRP
jgi:hypothetical protein